MTLTCDPSTGWEDDLNRNCVLKIDGIYKMWYTGQARGYSFIGYAESKDGIHFDRMSREPVMIPELPWEKESVMNPCVLYENGIYTTIDVEALRAKLSPVLNRLFNA